MTEVCHVQPPSLPYIRGKIHFYLLSILKDDIRFFPSGCKTDQFKLQLCEIQYNIKPSNNK